ncbi:MAG: cell division protein FtsL [Desulfobacteraceae bacterium]|nr:cell division protein FtsL [Desulfobacteraceae bacterium]
MEYVPNKRVTPKKQEKRPTKWLVLTLIFLSQLFLYTLIRLEASQTRTDISKLQMRQQELKAKTSILIIEKETLSSPERILKIARSDLNLSTPTADQVFYLDLSE